MMTRRNFLTTSALTLALPAWAADGARKPLRFGVITDVHQDIMHDGVARITAFVTAMQQAKVDFIIQLGDFCVPHARNQAFIDAWNRFEGPRYHVLGNHDTDGGYKKETTRTFWGMPANYYAFDQGGIRFLVLDGNDPGGKSRGYARFIGKEQQEWLRQEITNAKDPVIVCSHQPLESAGGIENQQEIRGLFGPVPEQGRRKVIACLSGHMHQDYVRSIDGIPHVQCNSASYVWLEGAKKAEVYPAAVHQSHPHLARVAPYRDPLWAVVSIDSQAATLTLQGTRTEWVGEDPWQRGVAETQYPRDIQRPAISDRSLGWNHKA